MSGVWGEMKIVGRSTAGTECRPFRVMPGLVPGIHDLTTAVPG
ncbi:hypothetical protein C8P69_105185 [Phreatobacter oligotrophus]|uniref:Uncharacterized protein n=1 Tax=Phreatobacter oligotrophus TaxID=1122261 RepID=A0A2T4Z2P4_9HYPH|nr:hypothetical protein C8P69_105185 [Phreatobacter oligotrophus]